MGSLSLLSVWYTVPGTPVPGTPFHERPRNQRSAFLRISRICSSLKRAFFMPPLVTHYEKIPLLSAVDSSDRCRASNLLSDLE
jgi:hypothetical protein